MNRPSVPFATLCGAVILAFASALSGSPVAPSSRDATSPSPVQPAAGSRRITDNIPCSACHSTKSWRAAGSAAEGAGFDHSTTGFPLAGEHAHTPCVACHDGVKKIERACVSCHEDFHRGRLQASCDRCHSPAGWKATRPLEIHRMTRFPLTGMHVLADCSQCHVRASERRWTDAPIACFACHENDYRRPDLFPVHIGTATTAPLPRDCSLCHRAFAWVPAVPLPSAASLGSALRAAPLGHDVRFPIGFGVHRTANCDDCHASTAVPRAVRCTGCHAHDAVRVAAQHRQPVGSDGPSCLSCHPAGVRR